MSAPAPSISPELKKLLRALKLGRCTDTLPERLALARGRDLSHADFFELVLADEVARRETTSAALRARAAGLDADMRFENWDDTTKVAYDRAVLDELCSLRFVDAGHNALIMGPVGVGKTFVATALGHAAVRRRYSVVFQRTDVLLKRLRASRLDNSHDAEMRKLLRVDLLILDDFALQRLDGLDTSDVYDLIVERHRAASTVITPTGSRSSGWGRWPTLCWPSPPSTGCSRPPTSWCSKAIPTASTRSRASTSAPHRARAGAGGPRHDDDLPHRRRGPPADAPRPAGAPVGDRAPLHGLSPKGHDRRPHRARASARQRHPRRAQPRSLTITTASSIIGESALVVRGKWSHAAGETVVPSRWRATPAGTLFRRHRGWRNPH